MHIGVRADVLPPGTDCHHIILEDWDKISATQGTIFISMPSILDPSLAPEGRHVVHAFTADWVDNWTDLSPEEYEQRKEQVADELCQRMEAVFPGLIEAIEFREVGTPRTHRRYLSRPDGSYGPTPARAPLGVITMPLNSTDIPGLYCVGDSTFPGQGVNAVVFSGFGCAHRVMCDIGIVPSLPGFLDQGFRALLKMGREAAPRRGPAPEETIIQPRERERRRRSLDDAARRSGALASQEQRHERIAYPYIEAGALISNIVPSNLSRLLLGEKSAVAGGTTTKEQSE